MRLEIHEVVEKLAKARSKKAKVEILRENDSGALRDLCRGVFDDRIVWLLPTGKPPPYTPAPENSYPASFLKKCINLAYFAKGGKGDNLPPVRREKMFIELLEAIHPKDAELVIKMINKEVPKGLTRSSVEEAFPNLLG